MGADQETLSTGRGVWERPLGVSFADDLAVQRISDAAARAFYRNYHSYRPELDRVTIKNHGAYLDGELVGAVTYAMPRREDPVLGVPPDGTAMIEVARVCVGVDIPNLASCLLAASQDRFMHGWGGANGVSLLISFVHADYTGSMFAALRDKGWRRLRDARVARSGNRDYTGIEDEPKDLWVCPIDRDGPEVAELSDF